MNLDLSGKKALVCGSTAGIGWAVAKELANLGADITLFARNLNKLQACCLELEKATGRKHTYLQADFSNLENVERAIQSKEIAYSILINNSGGPSGGPILEENPEKFSQVFEQHLLVNHRLSQLLIPFMKEEKWGRIVNIISISVKQPIVGLGVSNTTRWGVAAWAKTLSKELSNTGITVNNVLPGYTKTGRLKEVNALRAQQMHSTIEEVEKTLLQNVPSGKFAEAEEVAAAVAFLCSPVAASINGINLPVDGGLSSSL